MARRGRAGIFEPVERWLRSRVRHPHYRHVYHGDVNLRAGRGTGFHHRFQGQNPPGARVRRNADGNEMILERNVTGTYRARVDVQGPDGNWYPKRGASSFFPDNWTPQTVDDTIQTAFRGRGPHPDDPDKWVGSANGLDIEGFYSEHSRDFWHSAWPTN